MSSSSKLRRVDPQKKNTRGIKTVVLMRQDSLHRLVDLASELPQLEQC